jgi:hypothetical protein
MLHGVAPDGIGGVGEDRTQVGGDHMGLQNPSLAPEKGLHTARCVAG